MTQPKWTPGPWQMNAPHGYVHEVVSVDNGYIICGFGPAEYSDRTNDANAKLIAAAPALYAALAAVSDMLFRRPDMVAVLPKMMGPAENAIFEAAGAALAKARGE